MKALLTLLPLVGGIAFSQAADFTVTTPGGAFEYTINGTGESPDITLVRGATYTFAINTSSFHPFEIFSTNAISLSGKLSANNIASGTITFTVPDAASNYRYRCGVHTFSGTLMGNIITVPPPAAPEIVELSVGDRLVLRSINTGSLSVTPEFSTNLSTTNWFALTVLSNRLVGTTNETFCGRPPGDKVFVRLRGAR